MTIEERNALVEDNIKLSYHFARIHKSIIPNIEYDDAFGIAQIALIKAAARYDPSKGAFSTYVAKAVRNEFIVELNKSNAMYRVPICKIAYLQAPINGDDITFGDTIADDDRTDDLMDTIMLQQALTTVTGREKDILVRYYCLQQSTPHIAKFYGVSHQRITQILTSSLLKIRRKLGGVNRGDLKGVSGRDFQRNCTKGAKKKGRVLELCAMEPVSNTSAAQGG